MEKKKEDILEENAAPTQEEITPVEVNNDGSATLSSHDHKMIDKDIKFRGPLSYRYLRLIGWVAMSVMFISMMLIVAMKIKVSLELITPEGAAGMQKAADIMSWFSELPLPIFLIANFAIILQHKNNYKKLMKSYGIILLAIYIGFIVVYYHYIVLLLMRIGDMSFGEARETSILFFTALGKQNGLVVNVFVDLFMCVLIMFFIDYTPKKHFKGKKIILFRLLVILPILYELGSATLMGFLGMNGILTDFVFVLPPEILPLIGKKPVGMIIAFVAICVFIKIRERAYIKLGGTREGYNLYIKTNRNSLRLSIMMSITFLVVAILDAVAILLPSILAVKQNPFMDIEAFVNVLTGFTIGKSACLILVVPFTMLFSYSRKHNNPKFDKLVPLIGIGMVVISIIETLFFGLFF